MCGRDLLRLPGVNPGQHRNRLQPVPYTFWLPAEGMHKDQGEKGCLGTNPLLAGNPFDPSRFICVLLEPCLLFVFSFSGQFRPLYLPQCLQLNRTGHILELRDSRVPRCWHSLISR